MKKLLIIILVVFLLIILGLGFSAYILKNKKPTPTPSPTPTTIGDEDLIGSFFATIDADMIDQAIVMLNPAIRQGQEDSWRENFSSIETIKVKKIEKDKEAQWDTGTHYYKVTLEVKTKGENNNFGWSSGEDMRWVTVAMMGDNKYIDALATGP